MNKDFKDFKFFDNYFINEFNVTEKESLLIYFTDYTVFTLENEIIFDNPSLYNINNYIQDLFTYVDKFFDDSYLIDFKTSVYEIAVLKHEFDINQVPKKYSNFSTYQNKDLPIILMLCLFSLPIIIVYILTF